MSPDENCTLPRMIYKVLILGTDASIQAGFLHRASGSVLSYRLYSSLGVGIGVGRVSLESRADITLQLWSIPSRERWPGLTGNFTKGQRGCFLVIAPEDIGNLRSILPQTRGWPRVPWVFVFVGEPNEREMMELCAQLGFQTEVEQADSVDGVLLRLAEMMMTVPETVEGRTLALYLDPSECPSATPEMVMDAAVLNTDEEVYQIAEMAKELGIEIRQETCVIPLNRGVAEVSIRTGAVLYIPTLCGFCANPCRRSSHICIVGQDTGWSSSGLSERALVTMAKIQALSLGEISGSIRDKLACASQCSNFRMSRDCDTDDEEFLTTLGYTVPNRTQTLLDAAERRVKEGKLESCAYDTLKRGLQKAKSRDEC